MTDASVQFLKRCYAAGDESVAGELLRSMIREGVVTREDRAVNGGVQRLYRCQNGRGASVVRHRFSYGGDMGLWELAVLKLDGESFELDYSTPLTSDVEGWLSEEAAEKLVVEVALLDPVE